MRSRLQQIARRFLIAGGLCLILAGPRSAFAGHSVFLALGDSITFGVGATDDATDISNGDRGYVGKYADYLAARSGGVRPTVINLAVSGETSSSFAGIGSGIDGPAASARNTNYTGSTLPSQESLMLTTIQNQLAAGNTISTVTMTLGANDLFVAVATPDFGASEFGPALMNFAANEARILGEIRGLLPSATIILPNYYDPYSPFANSPTSPLYPYALASAQAIPVLNGTIFSIAQDPRINAKVPDVYSLFPANVILTNTYITDGGNVHPKDAGYGMIASAVESVPEPSSILLVGIALAVVPVVRRRRRSTTSA